MTDKSNFLTSSSQWKSHPLSLSLAGKKVPLCGSSELQAPEGLWVDKDRQTETLEAARQASPHQAENQMGPGLVSPEAQLLSAPAPTLGKQKPGFSLLHAGG